MIAMRYLLLVLPIFLYSCSGDENYQIIEAQSPVNIDLTLVPYEKLSEYNFFKGNLKDLDPATGLLPYKPTSELFTDYAKKSRFVYFPSGSTGTYISDEQVINLPVGSVLIKSFFYENVAPSNGTKIIETRLLIKKQGGWLLANYVWNNEQTEAYLNSEGGMVPITWTENNVDKTVNYQIPSSNNCVSCHTLESEITPIGIKPQNLNSTFNYADGVKNQLQKWVEVGYLANTPSFFTSMVDYNDATQDLELRVRSYLDINCAHCHRDGGGVDFLPVRFAFEVTSSREAMGVCVGAIMQPPGIPHGKIIAPGNLEQSVLYFAMNTNLSNYKMPRIGRTVVHEEAVQMVGQWINGLPSCP